MTILPLSTETAAARDGKPFNNEEANDPPDYETPPAAISIPEIIEERLRCVCVELHAKNNHLAATAAMRLTARSHVAEIAVRLNSPSIMFETSPSKPRVQY
jgi:hypothetical protein